MNQSLLTRIEDELKRHVPFGQQYNSLAAAQKILALIEADREALAKTFAKKTKEKQLILAQKGIVNVPILFEINEIVAVIRTSPTDV